MRPSKTSKPATPSPPPAKTDGLQYWRLLLWLVFAANSLFFIPQCLDRYLAPRFFFLSLALLVGLFLLWKDLRKNADWRLHTFDLLLLGWYGMNLASIGWAFSWSEAVFYTQKVLLFFLTYWLVRQALAREEGMVRATLRQATTVLTFAVCGILLVQVGLAVSEHGLDNEHLYDYATGVFGNKNLASDFLFFLLIFNVLFRKEQQQYRVGATPSRPDTAFFWISIGLLTVLILLLQTRSVYVATVVGGLAYLSVRAIFEPPFFQIFKKKILPAGVVALGLLAAVLALKGSGNSLTERLNPLTYLESATANERRFVWYKTDLLNAEHFWWGVGNGSWKFWFPSKNIEGSYRLQEQNVVFTRVHNDYLEVRSEMGMVGAGLFCALFGVAFMAAIWGFRRQEKDARVRHDLLVLSAALLGYCVIQYFDFPRERIELQVVLAVLFAYIAFHARALWERWPGVFVKKWATTFLLLAAAGLMFNVLIGWNRVVGEIHNVRMLDAQTRRDYKTAIREAQAAQNRFYEYNDVALPLAWHEGVAYYQMNQNDQSVAAFERAYQLNPWSFQVINNYASALVKMGRYRDAIPLYEKVVGINPRYEDGKFNLAYVWYQVGDYQKAFEWVSRIDSVQNPQTDAERQGNNRLGVFRKTIEERMK